MEFKTFLDAIERTKAKLLDKSEADKAELYKKLDLGFFDQTQLLTKNSLWFASQIIDLNTSQYMYNSLKDWSDTTLAERITILGLVAELMKIGGARN